MKIGGITRETRARSDDRMRPRIFAFIFNLRSIYTMSQYKWIGGKGIDQKQEKD